MLRFHTRFVFFMVLLFFLFFSLWHFRVLIHTAWTLLSLPLYWSHNSSEFIITPEADGFDLSFANYSKHSTDAGQGYRNLVPPILHHINLGSAAIPQKWNDARQSCLDFHPGWEAHLWTDENAGKFVADKFPEFKATWDGYRYPIERVDALRYLVLYEYGGEHSQIIQIKLP